jgi:hypothetical protein
MKKIIIVLSCLFTLFCCKAQKNVIDISEFKKTNYLISNIINTEIVLKEMFKGSFYVNIFEISDSKISKKTINEGVEVLSSYLISCIPDGDYYTSSKLFKIQGLLNPKIKNINEREYPYFDLLIEYGEFNLRKTESFIIEGI